jgi:uncharacterized protein (DUF433 family)
MTIAKPNEDSESMRYPMSARVINRGRGPEIEGTRITVYDVMDYAQQGWHRDRIAALFRLSSRDIQAALDYIDAHRDEVTSTYQSIRTRPTSYHYAPEVEAKITASRQRAQARLLELKAIRMGEHEEQHDGGHHS